MQHTLFRSLLMITNALKAEIMNLNSMVHLSLLTDFKIRVVFKDDYFIKTSFQNQHKMLNHANTHQTSYKTSNLIGPKHTDFQMRLFACHVHFVFSHENQCKSHA